MTGGVEVFRSLIVYVCLVTHSCRASIPPNVKGGANDVVPFTCPPINPKAETFTRIAFGQCTYANVDAVCVLGCDSGFVEYSGESHFTCTAEGWRCRTLQGGEGASATVCPPLVCGDRLRILSYPAPSLRVVGRQDITITVAAAGVGPILYEWYFLSDKTRKETQLVDVASTPSLTINADPSAGLNGSFRCKVSNIHRSLWTDYSHIVAVRAAEPIVFDYSMSTISAQDGDKQVVFPVSLVQGTRPINFQWYKVDAGNSKSVTPLINETSSILRLYDITMNTAGVYMLSGSNANSKVPVSFSVNVVVLPKAPAVVSHPVSLSAVRGSTVVFDIKVEGTGPIQYTWFRAGASDPISFNTSLVISNVELTDEGYYYVAVTNAATSTPILSRRASLDVTVARVDAIIVMDPLPQLSIVEGQGDMHLETRSSGSSPLRYQWYFRPAGGAYFYSLDPSIGTSSKLVIPPMESTFEGVYQCGVGNDINTKGPLNLWSRPSYVDLVKEGVLPTIFEQPWPLSVLLGDVIQVSVSVMGLQPITYQWQKSLISSTTDCLADSVMNSKWVNIPEGDSSLLSFTNTKEVMQLCVRVKVENPVGVAYSLSVLIERTKERLPLVIVREPEPVATLTDLKPFMLMIIARGTYYIEYQWFKVSEKGYNFIKLIGEQSPYLSVSNGGKYFCKVDSYDTSVSSKMASISALPDNLDRYDSSYGTETIIIIVVAVSLILAVIVCVIVYLYRVAPRRRIGSRQQGAVQTNAELAAKHRETSPIMQAKQARKASDDFDTLQLDLKQGRALV